MDELRKLLNTMTRSQQDDFAARCGTSVQYLRKAISIKQKLRPSLCLKIEIESRGTVTRKLLRNDWAEIWTDLQEEEPA